jgi:hypothetical protein
MTPHRVVRISHLLIASAVIVGVCLGATVDSRQRRTFKVSTWNIRSGMGITGFTTTHWKHDTLNCSEKSRPLNAWGMGLPQRELTRIKDDESIVALALQEAWNCALPQNVNEVLGFRGATREQNGIAILARHGFAGDPTYERVDAKLNSWLVGGQVCLDAACSASLPMYSTHWGGSSDVDLPPQAEATIRLLRKHPGPHVFMGDLNTYTVDRWSPLVPCATPDKPGRTQSIGLVAAAGYVDAWKATQDGEGWTGMANRSGCGDPKGNLFKRIDFVFTRGLEVLGADRFGHAAPGADAASDHAGVTAEIAWPSPSTR